MRSSTQDWLIRASGDLWAVNNLLGDIEQTRLVAENCRQCVEKCFRAMAEYRTIEIPPTYNLIQMKRLFNQYPAELDMELLRRLNNLSPDSCNPMESGSITKPDPTLEEATRFFDLARKIMEITMEICKDENEWDKSMWNFLPIVS
jgi:HEPN domain-containing protein